MCGIGEGAAVAGGTTSASDAAGQGESSYGGSGTGMAQGAVPSGSAAVGMGAWGGNMTADNPTQQYGQTIPSFAPGQHGVPTSAGFAIPGSDIAKGLAIIAPPPLGTFVSAMNYAGAFEGQGGDIGAIGGGPGADPRPAYMQGQPSSTYAGPQAPPISYSGPTVINPEIRSSSYYSVERGRTPEEIDAANRLRAARESAYAKQRADSEAELLKALGRRDVALTGGMGGRLSEQTTSSEKFVGTPPTLGQSRHYWA